MGYQRIIEMKNHLIAFALVTLAKAVKNGDRPSSAAAHVLRGDLIMEAAKNDKSEIRRALTDGYLRVVLLYQDDPCKEIRREALLKAADCHEKLGRSDLAENFRKQAKAEVRTTSRKTPTYSS